MFTAKGSCILHVPIGTGTDYDCAPIIIVWLIASHNGGAMQEYRSPRQLVHGVYGLWFLADA
jgi:hypothetical protein